MRDIFFRLHQYDVNFGEEHADERHACSDTLEDAVDHLEVVALHARVGDDVDDDRHGDRYHGECNVACLVVVLRHLAHEISLVGADEDQATAVAPKQSIEEALLERT